MWTWIIVIVVLIIIGWLIWGGKSSDMAVAPTDTTGTTTGSAMTGGNGSTAGSNSGSATNIGSNSGANGLPAIPSDATLMGMFNVSKMRVPSTGVDVALSGGQASYTDGTNKGTVALGSILAKVTTTDGYDVFVNLTVTKIPVAGTGSTANYIALFHVKNNVANYTSAVLVGNGLPVRSVEAKANPAVTAAGTPVSPFMDAMKGYLVTVSYLDRKNNEPMTTAPSVTKDFTATVKEHIISK